MNIPLYLSALYQSGQLGQMELRQLRFIYQSVFINEKVPAIEKEKVEDWTQSWEPKDKPLLLLLTLLLCELHKGSTLFPDSTELPGADVAWTLLKLAKNLNKTKVEAKADDEKLLPQVWETWAEKEFKHQIDLLLKSATQSLEHSSKSGPWNPNLFRNVDEYNPSAIIQPLILRTTKGWSFQRAYLSEKLLENNLSKRLKQSRLDTKVFKGVLKEILVEKGISSPTGQNLELHYRQMMAIALACNNNCTIISGGPGTGKTLVVTQILRALIRLDSTLSSQDIALAAPTGRAAARMKESIQLSLANTSEIRDEMLFQIESYTLHRLLGYNGNTGLFSYGSKNPLPYQIVIVDETSMLDIHLFSLFLEALKPDCRLILLGDSAQLPSVDAGSVLGDLSVSLRHNTGTLTKERIDDIQILFQNIISINESDLESLESPEPENPLTNHLILLTKSHRFAGRIGELAKSISKEMLSPDFQKSSSLKDLSTLARNEDWVAKVESIKWTDLLEQWESQIFTSEWKKSLEHVFESNASNFDIQQNDSQDAKLILSVLNQGRMICPLKEGERGCIAINQFFQKRHKGEHKIYAGMPIMVTQNQHSHDLFNGDVGIVVKSNMGLRVLFTSLNKFKMIPLEQIRHFDLAYASTIHKSQGSEYKRVLLVLPDYDHRLLTKELFFTACTRASQCVEIFGWENDLHQEMLARKIDRHSGLFQG